MGRTTPRALLLGLPAALVESLRERGWTLVQPEQTGDAPALLATQPFDLAVVALDRDRRARSQLIARWQAERRPPLVVSLGPAQDSGAHLCLPWETPPARVAALISQHLQRPPAPTRLWLGPHRLDLERGRLERTPPIALTDTERRLLRYLAQRPGQPVPRDDLLREVWGFRPGVETRAIDNCVRRLRRKIEPVPATPRFLLSERGVGYRLAGTSPVAAPGGPAPSAPHAGVPAEPRAPAEPSAAAPPPGAEAATRRHLASFGRQAELARLVALVSDGAPLVTLSGPGGIGKTHLLRRLAQARPAQPALWCDASPLTRPEQLTALVAGVALHSPSLPSADAQRGLPELLASRGPLLLLIDNLEQIAAGAAPLLQRWLERAPRLQLVISSRLRLQLPLEQLIELGPLPREDARALFAHRAEAAGANPDLTDPALDQLIARLDGLPLALEFAAARSRLLAPSAIMSRLAAGRALGTPVPGRPARQATLETTLLWSWRLLTSSEQRALARLSLLPEPVPADLAAALLEDLAPDPLALLETLADHSLLRREPGPRLRLLVLVRDFAARRLAALDPSEAHLARGVARWLKTGPEPSLQAAHRRTLRAAWSACAQLDEHERVAVEWPIARAAIAQAGDLPLARRGAQLERALSLAQTIEAAPALGEDLQRQRAGLLVQQGRRDEARTALAALAPTVQGALLLGRLEALDGRPEPARAAYHQAGALARGSGDRRGIAASWLGLGSLVFDRGDWAGAEGYYQRAMRTLPAELHESRARLLCNLGTAQLELARLPEARRSFEQAEGAATQAGARRQTAVARALAAWVRWEQQAAPSAITGAFEDALLVLTEVGDLRWEGFVRGLLAMWWARRDPGAARLQAETSLACFEWVQDLRFCAIGRARLRALGRLAGETPPSTTREPDFGDPQLRLGLALLSGVPLDAADRAELAERQGSLVRLALTLFPESDQP